MDPSVMIAVERATLQSMDSVVEMDGGQESTESKAVAKKDPIEDMEGNTERHLEADLQDKTL